MGARKLEHGVVPTATGEHGEDDDEAVEEGVEVELEGVRLRYWGQVHRRVKVWSPHGEELHTQKDVDEHKEEEEQREARDVFQGVCNCL